MVRLPLKQNLSALLKRLQRPGVGIVLVSTASLLVVVSLVGVTAEKDSGARRPSLLDLLNDVGKDKDSGRTIEGEPLASSFEKTTVRGPLVEVAEMLTDRMPRAGFSPDEVEAALDIWDEYWVSADPSPRVSTKVYAARFDRHSNQTVYPLAWDPSNLDTPGVDRTDAYVGMCSRC